MKAYGTTTRARVTSFEALMYVSWEAPYPTQKLTRKNVCRFNERSALFKFPLSAFVYFTTKYGFGYIYNVSSPQRLGPMRCPVYYVGCAHCRYTYASRARVVFYSVVN